MPRCTVAAWQLPVLEDLQEMAARGWRSCCAAEPASTILAWRGRSRGGRLSNMAEILEALTGPVRLVRALMPPLEYVVFLFSSVSHVLKCGEILIRAGIPYIRLIPVASPDQQRLRGLSTGRRGPTRRCVVPRRLTGQVEWKPAVPFPDNRWDTKPVSLLCSLEFDFPVHGFFLTYPPFSNPRPSLLGSALQAITKR
jgi:hypothetical protein